MALTKAAARTRVRQHIRDTVTDYEFTDAVLDGYLLAALKEVAVHVLAVDADFYLSFSSVKAYTDALDKVDTSAAEQGFEFYPLPPNCASLRRVERSDGGYHYAIPILDPMMQEAYRFGFLASGRVEYLVDGVTTYANIANANATGSVSIWGNRFRIVPAPAAAGVVWRLYYDREPLKPEGESENVDIPAAFEEAFALAWSAAIISEDGDPLAAVIAGKLRGDGKGDPGELRRAKDQHARRATKALVPGPVW